MGIGIGTKRQHASRTALLDKKATPDGLHRASLILVISSS